MDADDTAKEGVPRHAHVPGGDGLQGFGDDLLGPYRLAVYQQRDRYVGLFVFFLAKKLIREQAILSGQEIKNIFAGAAEEWKNGVYGWRPSVKQQPVEVEEVSTRS